MSIKTFPAITPTRTVWGFESNTFDMTSPFNNTTQSVEMPGARWMAELTFDNNLYGSRITQMKSFLLSLRGKAGRFYLKDHSNKYTSSETPLVAGASQTGRSLNVDGLTISTTGIIPDGTMFTVNGELKMMIGDVSSDGFGAATIVFEPPLRASPPDNEPILLTNPTAVMQLKSDSVNWVNIEGDYMSLSFSCVESFFDSYDALTWG